MSDSPVTTISANAVDEVAQRLAAQAGVAWSTLSNHPGYQKYLWREKACDLLIATGAQVASAAEPEARAPTFLT